MKRTDEVRWRDLAHGARIMRALGLDAPSISQLKAAVRRRNPNIRKRKDGNAQSSAAWYRITKRRNA